MKAKLVKESILNEDLYNADVDKKSLKYTAKLFRKVRHRINEDGTVHVLGDLDLSKFIPSKKYKYKHAIVVNLPKRLRVEGDLIADGAPEAVGFQTGPGSSLYIGGDLNLYEVTIYTKFPDSTTVGGDVKIENSYFNEDVPFPDNTDIGGNFIVESDDLENMHEMFSNINPHGEKDIQGPYDASKEAFPEDYE